MQPLKDLLDRQSVFLVDATIPPDMTIAQWRTRRTPPRSASSRRRIGRPRGPRA